MGALHYNLDLNTAENKVANLLARSMSSDAGRNNYKAGFKSFLDIFLYRIIKTSSFVLAS